MANLLRRSKSPIDHNVEKNCFLTAPQQRSSILKAQNHAQKNKTIEPSFLGYSNKLLGHKKLVGIQKIVDTIYLLNVD